MRLLTRKDLKDPLGNWTMYVVERTWLEWHNWYCASDGFRSKKEAVKYKEELYRECKAITLETTRKMFRIAVYGRQESEE